MKKKDQIKLLLYDDEYILSPEQETILMERHEAYVRGEMKTYTIDEVKKRLNYTEE